jgi:catechol 2,3-dioxygenase-like lactoylglutathione lyase family enzyme
MRLNRAMIYVSDLDRMVAFYAGTLGLKLVEETTADVYVELDAGAIHLGLHVIPASARCERSEPVRPREQNPVKLNFEVEDVVSEIERLEALGVTIIKRPWGAYDGVDPEGNVFGICSA